MSRERLHRGWFFWTQTLIFLGLVGSLIVWLAVSPTPDTLRRQELNQLIAESKVGHTNKILQERLETQFTWLAKHANVKSRIAVNQPIRSQQVTLLVTHPEYSRVTHCGSGNALYDPGLDTIFVDESLLWPTEVNVIGAPSVNTMFGIENYGYVVSYTNFILGHELGHRQKHDKASAFFYYGWGDWTADLNQEQEADHSAITTLFAAREAGDEPQALKTLDALSLIGLNNADLTARGSASGDLLGGMLLMTDDLLFSSSPFSPYYSDRSHPSMLRRVDDAIRATAAVASDAAIRSETDLVRAELERLTALGNWKHSEMFFPGPLTRADVRGAFLWLGRTDIPGPETSQLAEQIYRVPISLGTRAKIDRTSVVPQLVKTGYSKVGEAYNFAEYYGAWVDEEFEQGDREIGLPAAQAPEDPTPEEDWGRSKWGGLESLGTAWRWPARGSTPSGMASERELLVALRRLIPRGSLQLGRPQWKDDAVVLPVAATSRKNETHLRLFRLVGPAPFHLVESDAFHFASSGTIDVSSAKVWNGCLWVPIRLGEGRSDYRVQLWRVSPEGSRLFDTAPFLLGQARYSEHSRIGGRLTPENPKFLPISGGRALFGYDHDSLYLVDENVSRLKLLFHPAAKGLRVTDLGEGLIMFWKLHARKAYLVATGDR